MDREFDFLPMLLSLHVYSSCKVLHLEVTFASKVSGSFVGEFLNTVEIEEVLTRVPYLSDH